MLAYGARPDPKLVLLPEVDDLFQLFIDTLFISTLGFFFVEFTSVFIKLTAMKLTNDISLDDEHEETVFEKLSNYILRKTAVPLRFFKVANDDVSMSPLFRIAALTGSYANSFVFFMSSVEKNKEKSAYLLRIAEAGGPLSLVLTCVFVFGNLNPTLNADEVKGRRSKWMRIAIDALIFVPFLLSIAFSFKSYKDNLSTVDEKSINPKANLIELCFLFSAYFLMAALCVANKYLIVSRYGTRDLKDHLNRVAYVSYSLICAMAAIVSSNNGCTIREFTEWEIFNKGQVVKTWECPVPGETCETFTAQDNRCETIKWATMPLYFVLAATACYNMWFGIFEIERPVTFERMSLLQLSKSEGVNSFVLGSCGATAIFMYGVGGEYDRDLRKHYVVPMQLVFLGLFCLMVSEEVRVLLRLFYIQKEVPRRDIVERHEDHDRRRSTHVEKLWRATTVSSAPSSPRDSVPSSEQPTPSSDVARKQSGGKRSSSSAQAISRYNSFEATEAESSDRAIGGTAFVLQLDPGLM